MRIIILLRSATKKCYSFMGQQGLVWHWCNVDADHLSPCTYVVVFTWTPHPAIVTIRDNKDYSRVLLKSYDTTITGWGVLLR